MYYNLFNIPQIFAESFDVYIKHGFTEMSVKFDLEPTTEDCMIDVVNKKNDRNLHFRFQTYNGPSRAFVSELVWFSIDNILTINKSYYPSILLYEYWKRMKGNEYRIVSLINQVKGDTFAERLKNYFDIVKDTLENDLKEVVEGKKWIDLHYDPRDDYG
jgi:hypothetical protein